MVRVIRVEKIFEKDLHHDTRRLETLGAVAALDFKPKFN